MKMKMWLSLTLDFLELVSGGFIKLCKIFRQGKIMDSIIEGSCGLLQASKNNFIIHLSFNSQLLSSLWTMAPKRSISCLILVLNSKLFTSLPRKRLNFWIMRLHSCLVASSSSVVSTHRSCRTSSWIWALPLLRLLHTSSSINCLEHKFFLVLGFVAKALNRVRQCSIVAEQHP